MSLSTLYYRVLTLPYAVPQPTTGGEAPAELIKFVTKALNLLAWAGTAAGVVGVLACGARMAISHKQGSSEHMGRLGLVLGGCALVAAAGPLVTWFFGSGGAATAPPNPVGP